MRSRREIIEEAIQDWYVSGSCGSVLECLRELLAMEPIQLSRGMWRRRDGGQEAVHGQSTTRRDRGGRITYVAEDEEGLKYRRFNGRVSDSEDSTADLMERIGDLPEVER